MTHFTFLPGLRRTVLDATSVQIGTDPERALILEFPEPQVIALLDHLDNWLTEADYYRAARQFGVGRTDAEELLTLLRDSKLIMDPAALTGRSSDPGVRVDQSDEAAALALRKTEAPVDVMAARSRRRVCVVGEGRMAAGIVDLLNRCGVGHVRQSDRRPADRADLAIVVNPQQPPTLTAEVHARRRLPYLMVTIADGAVNIGPLVVPGRTPCIACVEFHHRDAVPRWCLFGSDDSPVEVALRELAVATTACQAMQYLDGIPCQARATTIQLRPPFGMRRRVWEPHPSCGCQRADRPALPAERLAEFAGFDLVG